MWLGIATDFRVSLISLNASQALSLPTVNSAATLAIVRDSGDKSAVGYAQSVKSMDTEFGPAYFVETPLSFPIARAGHGRVAFDKEGLLGTDFLVKHGAVINCRTAQIFFSRDATKLPLTPKRYEEMGFSYIPIRITPRGFVEVDSAIMGTTYSFLINTGTNETLLASAIEKQAHVATHRAGVLLSFPYDGIKNEPVTIGRLRGFKLGDHDLSDFDLSFGQLPSKNLGLLHDWGGIIGTELLIHRNAIIDLGNRALYLRNG